MRRLFGWDLPPGCTQRHIDEAAGAYDDDGVHREEADLPHTEWKCDFCGFLNSCLDSECQNIECEKPDDPDKDDYADRAEWKSRL